MTKSLAIYAAMGLGDALLAAQLAHQLTLKGHRATLYSSVLGAMANWFPSLVIKPFPAMDHIKNELSEYDHVIAADHTVISDRFRGIEKITILFHEELDKKQTMLRNLLAYGRRVWDAPEEPGQAYRLPHSLQHRHDHKRVIMHPTSGAEKKNWHGEKFVRVGQKLRGQGYDPVMVISVQEAPAWRWVEEAGIRLEVTQTLDHLATLVYESGYFIGNDSGIGHMASLFHVPTVTVGARASILRLWRPGWGPGTVITPWLVFPGSRLQERYWKQFLSVGQVCRAFRSLERSLPQLTGPME